MEITELKNPDDARAYLLQSLWMQRVLRPAPTYLRSILEWAIEISSAGDALPPLGFVADIGAIITGLDGGRHGTDHLEVPGWPHTIARNYEDHVLGKVYADWSFERATDAIRRFTGRDRAKGIAYVIKQIRERGRIGGIELSPAVIRGLLTLSGDEVLNQGYELLERDGPMLLLVKQYELLMSAARRMAELLGPEDVIALEQRTALADMGQYVAHRQILQTTAKFESLLDTRPVKPLTGRKEVPTRVHDEDQYPVGGYSSISNRGSIESLLHSQLAFMDDEERPDQFDLKFVRDELFYYSRDENQFLRRRRVFTFIFDPALIAARFKDATLPCQRIVMIQAAVLTLIRRITEWLSADALQFELIFPQAALAEEAKLYEILLSELRAAGTAVVWHSGAVESPANVLASTNEAIQHAELLARSAQVHVLLITTKPMQTETDSAVVTNLAVNSAVPILTDGHGNRVELPTDDAFDAWVLAVKRMLGLWV